MKVILADKVSLNDNAKNSTIFFFLTGIGYGVGPRIGGYLTSVSWRWCFIVSTPMSLMTLVLAHFVMRPVLLGSQDMQMEAGVEGRTSFDKYVKRLSTLDFGGQLTFLFGMGLIVLALTWAGAYYPWSDAKVIGPLGLRLTFDRHLLRLGVPLTARETDGFEVPKPSSHGSTETARHKECGGIDVHQLHHRHG